MLQRAPNKFLRATSICFVSQERELQRCCWDEGGLHLQQPRTPEARFPRLRQLSSKRPQRPFNPRPGLFKLIRCTCRARRRTGCGQGRLSRQRQGQGTGGHRRGGGGGAGPGPEETLAFLLSLVCAGEAEVGGRLLRLDVLGVLFQRPAVARRGNPSSS